MQKVSFENSLCWDGKRIPEHEAMEAVTREKIDRGMKQRVNASFITKPLDQTESKCQMGIKLSNKYKNRGLCLNV